MAAAEAAMRMQSGELDRCIVGGVECCFEPRFLAACAKKALLKTAVSPVGFMPGEAAAFFLLEDVGKARARRAMISAHLGGASVVRGQSHRFSDDPPLGRAIHQAVQGALTQRPPAERAVAFVLGDLNGDEHRAMEWGHALVRLNAEFGLGTAPLWLPALSFGETGAATGALSVCLAARAFDRGYAPGGTALVWLLSESGAAAAFTLSRPPAGGS
jgi:3-oxoacyl-[acyl-carrier-protein] synthase-1